MNALRTTLLTVIAASTSLTWAAVPVEMRPLTPSSVQAPLSTAPTAVANDPNADPADQTSTLWKLYQQVQQLQQEVRDLRGRFESQEQQLDQTDKELKARFTDLDQRFDQLKNTVTPPEPTATDATTASPTDSTANSPNNTDATNTVTAATSTPATPATPVIPAAATPSSKPATPAAEPDADKRAYIGAYDAYKAGGAAKAIAPMQAFIKNYPNSVYISNAHYWLGEFYLATTPPNFEQAAKSFSVVTNQYPSSAKGAAATYRLATMADVGKRTNDAIRLMKKIVTDYPNTQEAGYAATFLKDHKIKI